MNPTFLHTLCHVGKVAKNVLPEMPWKQLNGQGTSCVNLSDGQVRVWESNTTSTHWRTTEHQNTTRWIKHKKRSSLTRVAPSLQNQATCHLAAFQPSNRGYRPAHAAKAPRFQSHAQGKPYIWDRFSRCLACAGGSQTNPWYKLPGSKFENLHPINPYPPSPKKAHQDCVSEPKKKNAAYSRFGHLRGAIG